MDIVYKIHVGPDNSTDSHGNQEIEGNEGFEEPAGDNGRAQPVDRCNSPKSDDPL